MSKRTPATDMLARAGIAFSVHSYDYDPEAQHIGLQAAEALGLGACSRPLWRASMARLCA